MVDTNGEGENNFQPPGNFEFVHFLVGKWLIGHCVPGQQACCARPLPWDRVETVQSMIGRHLYISPVSPTDRPVIIFSSVL